MEYDFDCSIDRSNSDSLKWRDTRGSDVIPMWVADMDFASPPCVVRAMHERVDHGVFGYSVPTDAVNQSVVAWALSHYDLKLTTERHIPFASLSEEIANRSITLMSPAKTFNTTGLNCGFAVIPNADLRRRFQNVASGMVPQPNGLGYAACQAAFEEGEAWRRDLIDYLRGNRDLLESFLSEKLPMFSMSHAEATYLAWIDTRWLGKRNAMDFFEMAGVQLSDGNAFGGRGFMRLNFGCPRERLRIALKRILQAVQSI